MLTTGCASLRVGLIAGITNNTQPAHEPRPFRLAEDIPVVAIVFIIFFSDVSPNTRVQVLGFPFDLLYIDMIASVDFLMGGYGYKLFALAV